MERRASERILLTIPVRVFAFGANGKEFSEDTHTLEVNSAGARIALKHRVRADDVIRIVNLENFREADFRVVGPTRVEGPRFTQWGVECLDQNRNIWGIEFSPPLSSSAGSRGGALLQCRNCGKQALHVLRPMELMVLESSGLLQLSCDHCGQFSPWTFADASRPRQSPIGTAAIPEPGPEKWDGKVERRTHKRLALKLPVLVRNGQGEQEIAKTENMSKGGLAVCLNMQLTVGEIVRVTCPYTEGGQNLEQRAEVRRRVTFTPGMKWLYGFRYLP